MKVAIVEKNASLRQRIKAILEARHPEHTYETYEGVTPWPELTDMSIGAMIIGSPMQAQRGIIPEKARQALLDGNTAYADAEWFQTGLDYMEALRLGQLWWESGKMDYTITISSRTTQQLPILFIHNSPLPPDWPQDAKFDNQFKTTFYKTCGATAICGYPFDQDVLCSAFSKAMDGKAMHQMDIAQDDIATFIGQPRGKPITSNPRK